MPISIFIVFYPFKLKPPASKEAFFIAKTYFGADIIYKHDIGALMLLFFWLKRNLRDNVIIFNFYRVGAMLALLHLIPLFLNNTLLFFDA